MKLKNNQTQDESKELFNKMPPTEKFQVLFDSIKVLDELVNELITRNKMLQDSLLLLHKKMEASLKIQSITDEQIDSVIESIELSNLQQKVKDLLNKGILKPADLVQEDSFIVLRVLKDNKVYTKRAQLAFSMLSEDLKDKFKGLKKGDAVTSNEFVYEVQEIYSIEKQIEQEDKNDSESNS